MIITIGRQHGSCGHEVARVLAKQLGIKCYDKEIVDEAASNSEFSKEIFHSYDEKRVSPFIVPASHYMTMIDGFRLNMQVASAQFEAIRTIAEKGDCIFVGRCVDYILRSREDIVKVFIYADMDSRIKSMMEKRNLSEEQAAKLIKDVDKDRASYYKYYTDQIWGETGNYDICVNDSKIGVDGAAEVIIEYLRVRGMITK